MSPETEYRISPSVTNQELNELFADAWPGARQNEDFGPVLRRSLGYVCAYQGGDLVGFVNVAWDGGVHAFLLDTTVRSDCRRQGIGRQLLRACEEQLGTRRIRLSLRSSNDAALALYRGSGYKQVDSWPKYYRDGEDALVMELSR